MRAFTLTAAALTLAACGPVVLGGQEQEGDTTTQQASVTPSGPPLQVAPLTGDHPEAWVTDTVFLANAPSGAKVYSVSGGDPAINGLYTYIAGYDTEEPGGGWNVFQIGDFNSWSVVEDRGTDVVLAVNRSFLNNNGEVQTVDERYIVSIPTAGATSITVTPAN